MLSIEAARMALAVRVSPRTLAHAERVAETAAGLAGTYDSDPQDALLAGLLHDWGKDLPDQQLFAEADRLGVDVAPADRRAPQLLHARVGAAQIVETFPDVPATVVSAVAHHTLGAVEMTDLDRIVYIADSIEPQRRYDGVDELRAGVGHVPLPELFVRCMASGIRHVVATRRTLHPMTVAVWNAALGEADS